MENDVSVYQCFSIAHDVEPDAFRRIKCGNENWEYYRTMVLFLFGTFNGFHDEIELFNRTKFSKKLIKKVCENLTTNGIWKDGLAYVDPDDENFWMEIVLCTMAAMGQIVRTEVSNESEVPVVDILKIQKERESKPYEFDKNFLRNIEPPLE